MAAPSRTLPQRKTLIGLVLLAALLGAGAFWLVDYQRVGRYLQRTNDAIVEADVSVVAPRINGYVREVLVSDNQDVRTGQPLVRIDPQDYRLRVAQAQAQAAQADAGMDAARAGASEQQAMVAQVEAQLAAARARAAHDAGEVRRYTPLVATGAERGERLAQLRSTAAQSAADVRVQMAALTIQRRRTALFEAQFRQAEGQGKAAQTQIATAAADMGDTVIRAALAGRIGDRTVTVGQYVQAGTRLMSVVPLHSLYVTANFKETQLALVRRGQPVKITVDALDGFDLRGRVESIAPGTGAQFALISPSNATGNFTKIVQRVPVRISIEASPAAKRLLVPGLSVIATIDTRSARQDVERVRREQARYARISQDVPARDPGARSPASSAGRSAQALSALGNVPLQSIAIDLAPLGQRPRRAVAGTR